MAPILAIVLPVFGLIGLGWLSARVGYISRDGGRMLAQFAFKIAMPALLFRTTLTMAPWQGDPVLLAAAYFSFLAVIWLAASIATSVVLGRSAEDAPAIAMGACFGNTVMLGIPVAVSTFGDAGAVPAALLITIETPLLWLVATTHMEFARARKGAFDIRMLGNLAAGVALNPIVLPLLLGTAGRMAGLALPPVLDKMLTLVAQAAVPSALVALGTTMLAFEGSNDRVAVPLMIGLKMVAFPPLVFLAATWLALPGPWIGVATLLAAMPVGANAYLFAARYDRAVGPVSVAVASSTALAVVTVTAVLYLLRTGGVAPL